MKRWLLVLALVLSVSACHGSPQPRETYPIKPGAVDDTDIDEPSPAYNGVEAAINNRHDHPRCQELQRRADDANHLVDWLGDHLSEDLQVLLDSADTHRLQLLVGELVDAGDGLTCLVQHGFRVDVEYFYPASSIKTLASIAALQRLAGDDTQPSVDIDDPLWFEDILAFNYPQESIFDPLQFYPLQKLIKDAQIVSSNPAYNRLFDFVGHEQLNRSMWEAGLESTRLQHRFFSPLSTEQQKWSPAVWRVAQDGSHLQLLRPQQRSSLDLPPIDVEGQQVGQSYIEDDAVIDTPMDFSTMNYLSLRDHQELMIALFHPELSPVSFEGLNSGRDILIESMLYPPVDYASYLDDEDRRRFKTALSGFEDHLSEDHIDYFNKGGRAYGFHIENAFVTDRQSQRGVFLTAALYVNENERLNDGDYQYDELSFPFLHQLGSLVAQKFLVDND